MRLICIPQVLSRISEHQNSTIDEQYASLRREFAWKALSMGTETHALVSIDFLSNLNMLKSGEFAISSSFFEVDSSTGSICWATTQGAVN